VTAFSTFGSDSYCRRFTATLRLRDPASSGWQTRAGGDPPNNTMTPLLILLPTVSWKFRSNGKIWKSVPSICGGPAGRKESWSLRSCHFSCTGYPTPAPFWCCCLKIWRQHNPHAGFREELDAIERYLPKATQYRDERLDELFNHHWITENMGTKVDQHGRTLALDVYAERLYSTFQRLEYDAEWTHGYAVYEALQGMLASGSREDRKQLLCGSWILIISRCRKSSRYPNSRKMWS